MTERKLQAVAEDRAGDPLPSFDDPADESELVIVNPTTGEPTTWVWKIAGPGHAKTQELRRKSEREALQERRLLEQAQANGKKWKAPERTPEDEFRRFTEAIAQRVLHFTPAEIAGQRYDYSPEACRTLLADPRRAWLRKQLTDYLLADESFFPKPAKN